MTVTINGTTGVAGVDGTAGTPSYQGNDSNTGIFFPAADTIAFAEGGAEVARFDSSGNFGIGTTSPTQKLDIVGQTARISNAGTANFTTRNATAGVNWEFGVDGGGNGFIYTGQASGMTISTNANPRVNVASNGARQFTTQNQNTYYAGDATFTLSNSTITFDLATIFPDLVGNGSGMGIMLLINQWNGGGGSGITQLTIGQKSGAWSFSTIATTGTGSGSSVSGSGTVITVTAGAGFGQVRVWATSRN
jgi:hypothetical protein